MAILRAIDFEQVLTTAGEAYNSQVINQTATPWIAALLLAWVFIGQYEKRN